MNGNMLVKDQMWHFAVVFWIPAFAGMTAGTGAEVLHSFRNRLISLEPRRTRRQMAATYCYSKCSFVLFVVDQQKLRE